MSSTSSINQPSDNNSGMSGNQTENLIRWPDSILSLTTHHQYPEGRSGIELGAKDDAAEHNLLTLSMTRSEEPITTTEHVQQINHSNAMQHENSLVIPSGHHISEPAINPDANQGVEDDLKTTANTVAVLAVGVSIPGIFGVGQLFRGNHITHCSSLCFLIASLMFLCTSFVTGIFLFVFSKTQRNLQNMSRIIQLLLWFAEASTTLGVLLAVLYIILHGL